MQLALGLLLGALCAGCAQDSSPTAPTVKSATVTRVVAGRVTDDDLRPVADAGIASTLGAFRARSDANGEFAFTADTRLTFFTVERDGYELSSFVVPAAPVDVSVNVVLQPFATVNLGSTLSLSLNPLDRGRYVGEPYESDYCRPCQVARVVVPTGTRASVQVRWDGREQLAAWLDGAKMTPTADGTGTSGEVEGGVRSHFLYVGLPLKDGLVQTLDRQVALQVNTFER